MGDQLVVVKFWDGSCGKHQELDILLYQMLPLFLFVIIQLVSVCRENKGFPCFS